MMLLMTDVTQILNAIQDGDPSASDQLFPLVYEELRRLARQKLAHEKPGQTLQATALVHEAWLRLAREDRQEPWHGRRQFFSAAAEAIRRILVENARHKKSLKRGGKYQRQDVELQSLASRRPDEEILALDEALQQLALEDPVKAELVKLRYFVGMTVQEAAEALGISPSSVDRKWAFARAWLGQQISGRGDLSPNSENSQDP